MPKIKYRDSDGSFKTLLDTAELSASTISGWSLVNCSAVGFDVVRFGRLVSIVARIKVTSSVGAGKELNVATGLPAPFGGEGGRGSAWANSAYLNGTVYVNGDGALWLQNKGSTSLGTSEYVFVSMTYLS